MDVGEEVTDAVMQCPVDMGDIRFLGNRGGRHILEACKRQYFEILFVFRCRIDDVAASGIGCTRSVERVDRLAVVLQSDAVDVKERDAGFSGLTTEDAVALVVLAERIR